MNLLATAADYAQLLVIIVGLVFWAGVALLIVRLVRAPQKPGSTPTGNEMRTVRVRGEAVVPGAADAVSVLLEIAHVAKTPTAALADVGKRSKALERILDALDVPKDARRTTGAVVYEQREWDHTSNREVSVGYRASAQLRLKLTEAEKLGEVMSRAVADVKATMYGPTWHVERSNPVHAEACRAAAEDARRRSEAYANALGARVGGVVGIDETVTARSGWEYTRTAAAGPAVRAPLQVPTIEMHGEALDVLASVTVTFLLEPR